MSRTSAARPLAAALAAAALSGPAAADADSGPAAPRAVAPAARASTSWTGWAAPGPLGVGPPARVAAQDGATFVLGGDRTAGTRAFRLDGPSGTRIGRVPIDGEAPAVGSAGERRLFVADGCTVRTSSDRGATWAAATLPGCTTGSRFDAPGLSVLDADVAWAGNSLDATWRTVDGGRTWSPVEAVAASRPVPGSPDVAYRLGPFTTLGKGVQRTTDGGATWQHLEFVTPPSADGAPGVRVGRIGGLGPVPLVVRADGALVVGGGSFLEVSTDGGTTSTPVPLPEIPDAPDGARPVVDQVVCDPASACVVGVDLGDRRIGLRLDGTTLGARVAPPPVADASSPAPGVVVGRAVPSSSPADVAAPAPVVRTDDLGVTPYRTIVDRGDARPGSFARHGTLAIATGDRLRLSADAGATWSEAPLTTAAPGAAGPSAAVPDGSAPAGVVRAGGAWVALTATGGVARLTGGTWAPLADVSALVPRGIAASGDDVVVAGDRGLARISPAGTVTRPDAPVLRGHRFARVTAAGRTVVAWSPSAGRSYAVRSADGGVTWTRTTLPRGTDDVQLASPSVAYALDGRRLYRAVDRSSFRPVSIAPRLGGAVPTAVGPAGPALAFSSASRGLLLTSVGAFVTGNGGRTLEAVPTPGGLRPAVGAVSGAAVALQDPATGTLLRHDALLRAAVPRLELRTDGPVKRGRAGARTVTVAGRLTGAVAGTPVVLHGARTPDAETRVLRVVRADARGRFRARLRLTRGLAGVQARFAGAVRAERTLRGSASRFVRVPRVR